MPTGSSSLAPVFPDAPAAVQANAASLLASYLANCSWQPRSPRYQTNWGWINFLKFSQSLPWCLWILRKSQNSQPRAFQKTWEPTPPFVKDGSFREEIQQIQPVYQFLIGCLKTKYAKVRWRSSCIIPVHNNLAELCRLLVAIWSEFQVPVSMFGWSVATCYVFLVDTCCISGDTVQITPCEVQLSSGLTPPIQRHAGTLRVHYARCVLSVHYSCRSIIIANMN